MPLFPKKWSAQELTADATEAIGAFRHGRLEEPKELYDNYFGKFSGLFAELVEKLPELLADPLKPILLGEFVRGPDRKKAFRYLTAPPISEDDLKTLADASIGPNVFRDNHEAARRVRDIIRTVLDQHRFPWIGENRLPSDDEIERAIVTSAALAAARDVEKSRRSTAKEAQEAAVKELLASLEMKQVAPRPIPNLTAPTMLAAGEFCGESAVAGTRADVVARLWNSDLMLIECKVSNSAVNSYKRLVHDTGGKAAHWYRTLGTASTIPCAVLGGVFSRANLETAQNEKDVFLFWQHRLSDLADFVNKAK